MIIAARTIHIITSRARGQTNQEMVNGTANAQPRINHPNMLMFNST